MEENTTPIEVESSPARKPLPLWKWIFAILGGFLLFSLLYSLSGAAELVGGRLVTALLQIVALSAGLLLYKYLMKPSPDDLCGSGIPDIGKGFLVGLLFLIAVIGVMAMVGVYRITSVHFYWLDLLCKLVLFLWVAVYEEIIFRGVLFRMIDRRFGYVSALVVSALLFGFMHYFQGTLWSSIAIAIEAGLMLGAAYKLSGNLYFPIGIHWAWNFAEGCIFGTQVSGAVVATSVFTSEVSGPDIVSGGEFGPEASIIACVLGALLSAYFIYLYLRGRRVNG